MRNFNFRVFLISSIVIASLACPSLYVAATNIFAEGFVITLAEITATIFGFPILMVTLSILKIDISLTTAFILMLLNIFLYAVLVERLFRAYKKRTKIG